MKLIIVGFVFVGLLAIWGITFYIGNASIRKAYEKKQLEITATAGAVFKSPMDCIVLEVKISTGETVKKGQILFVIESGKMQFEIPSAVDGMVKEILTPAGKIVRLHEIMVTFY